MQKESASRGSAAMTAPGSRPANSWHRTASRWIQRATSMSAKSALSNGRTTFRIRRCRRWFAACRSWKGCNASFRLEAGRLDDRPPPFRFGFLESTQGFGRLLGERRDLDAEFLEALLHRGIGEDLDHGGIQFRDDILRRISGCPKSVPERSKEAGQPRLVRGRNIQ